MNFTEDTLATEVFGVPRCDEFTTATDLLDAIDHCGRWQSHLSWAAYTRAADLHARTTSTAPEQDLRLLDDHANTAVRLAATLHLSKAAADAFLREALALIHRIPRIGECLRDGVITLAQFKRLVTLTDLIEGQPYAPDVDESVARELRCAGSPSMPRLRDMADRVIFRYDPDAVRHRREKAVHDRSAGSRRLIDGMARIDITASAEDIVLAMAAVEELAKSVCPQDPRTPNARRSDAAISRLQEAPFRCQCDRADCPATTADQSISDRHARIVLHAIWESPAPGTAAGPHNWSDTVQDIGPDDAEANIEAAAHLPKDHQLGFLDGHGVISADHIRAIASRPDTIFRPLNPHPGQPLPAHLPSDPYRFSAALDTYIRARDGYCVFPGCTTPAWSADIDHVTEYDHHNPDQGGRTTPINGNVKCRYHHLFKTFGNWLDDQYIGSDGLTHTEFITPEGHRINGHGHTNEDLFPALRNIRFESPPTPAEKMPSACDPTRAAPSRRRTRHADKLARRRHERNLNKLKRESDATGLPDPPLP